jgi:UDPglucose--hexose-1-phosphate uridylyltransferase
LSSSAGPPAPEIRLDQLTGLRTILAPARAERPFEFAAPDRPPPRAEDCPFCEGREERTPPETWAERPEGGAENAPGWRLRAVPNLYPALAGEEASERRAPAGGPRDPLREAARGSQPDLFARSPASGHHEVIVHSPHHHRSLAELADCMPLDLVLAGWRTRMRALSGSASYLQLIVNEGAEAGASLEHSHAQLYALGFVPAAVARERERARAYYETTAGGQLLADVVTEEVRRRERLVAIDDEAALVCPWASRSPFELRLIPRSPQARFEDDDRGAGMLHAAVRALATRFGAEVGLNLWVRTAPRGAEPFCWHIDLVPRLAIKAGFELSTGVDINTYPPERAAWELREALSP